MCLVKKPKVPGPVQVAAYDNVEATQTADMEARARRRRAGAAMNVLTGPTGIPAGRPTLGGA